MCNLKTIMVVHQYRSALIPKNSSWELKLAIIIWMDILNSMPNMLKGIIIIELSNSIQSNYIVEWHN